MKFLIDAQLPRRLTRHFAAAGHDAVHTLDLPAGNRTTDAQVCDLAEREQRVVATKDGDFVNSFIVSGRPPKLLLISTGNIDNAALEALLVPHIPAFATRFESHSFIELDRMGLILHG